MGGCLSQTDDQGRLRPVAYFSKRLNGAEVNYPIHDKELLAIIACMKEWKAELQSVSKPFTILTDHKNLDYFSTKRLLSERQARYNEILQQFRFNIKWRAGRACERPDALSRRDQDKPKGADDDRTTGRVMQLFTPVSINIVKAASAEISINEHNESKKYFDELNGEDQATAAIEMLFDDPELQNLWIQGVKTEKDWQRARDSVQSGDRAFPSDIAQKLKFNIGECSV